MPACTACTAAVSTAASCLPPNHVHERGTASIKHWWSCAEALGPLGGVAPVEVGVVSWRTCSRRSAAVSVVH